jgi:hypothetical protein
VSLLSRSKKRAATKIIQQWHQQKQWNKIAYSELDNSKLEMRKNGPRENQAAAESSAAAAHLRRELAERKRIVGIGGEQGQRGGGVPAGQLGEGGREAASELQ